MQEGTRQSKRWYSTDDSTCQSIYKLNQIYDELGAVADDEHQDDDGQGRRDVEVSAPSVGDLELVTAPLDVDEGESVENGEEKEGQEVEEEEVEEGGEETVGLVDPERGGEDVADRAPGGGQGHVVLGDLPEGVRDVSPCWRTYLIERNFPNTILEESGNENK